MQKKEFRTMLGRAPLTVELTPLAAQANGRVIVGLGDTQVLVTAVMSQKPREGQDFFPLTVDYEEKFYAAGKILGSRFVKRESRPSEEAVLTARLIDRTIRPRFDLGMRNEVQVVATVLSLDDENDPDVCAILGASLALSLSDIPWAGPLAAVRLGRVNGELTVNPTFAERSSTDLDMVVAGESRLINMIEAGASEVPEAEVMAGLHLAQTEIQKLISFEQSIIETASAEKSAVDILEPSETLRRAIRGYETEIAQALFTAGKQERSDKLIKLKEKWFETAARDHADEWTPAVGFYLWEDALDRVLHQRILKDGVRPDGRRPDELRPIEAYVGTLPRVHGSGLFIRGETQALSTLTLGAPKDELTIEGMEIRTKRRFMHHYNFPPYSTGEVKPMRGPGRREIGHGALAERALTSLIPLRETFPYTIRVVSEILSSNGSSSMAAVCGASLALFDAGVPLKNACAGIAIGLMLQDEAHWKTLTDIQGPEDHYGDMDFKAAGTSLGLTALQMDVKVKGVTLEILEQAFRQAKEARSQILDIMAQTLAAPRPELSSYAPRIQIIKIPVEKIGTLIGPGGKVINGIIADTGAQIDIEEDGTVYVTAEKEESFAKALALIKQVTREFKPGDLLEGQVSRIFDFGAMVEVGPKQEGLIHISELAPWHVERVEDVVRIGERLPVVVKNIDEQGRLNLSLKSVPGRYPNEGAGPQPGMPHEHSSPPAGGRSRPTRPYGGRSRPRPR